MGFLVLKQLQINDGFDRLNHQVIFHPEPVLLECSDNFKSITNIFINTYP
jgi:hypothetical protein